MATLLRCAFLKLAEDFISCSWVARRYLVDEGSPLLLRQIANEHLSNRCHECRVAQAGKGIDEFIEHRIGIVIDHWAFAHQQNLLRAEFSQNAHAVEFGDRAGVSADVGTDMLGFR